MESSSSEKENYCHSSFDENGPYWHLYTSGKETPLMFRSHDDYLSDGELFTQLISIIRERHQKNALREHVFLVHEVQHQPGGSKISYF